jgi:hypothetical protein
MDSNISREEFEGFIAEVESFRDTILDEFTKLRADLEKIKYQLEELDEYVGQSGKNNVLGQRKLG